MKKLSYITFTHTAQELAVLKAIVNDAKIKNVYPRVASRMAFRAFVKSVGLDKCRAMRSGTSTLVQS